MKPMSAPAWRVYSAAIRLHRVAGGTVGLAEMRTAAELATALEAGDREVAEVRAEALGISLADLPGLEDPAGGE